MPLQNRVHPNGSLFATKARGTMLGNRGGRMHDPASQHLKTDRSGASKARASKAWISCQLSFKGRQRSVWGNSYTELFFTDEVTALAAGHRPCFECRRNAAKRFQACLHAGLGADQNWNDLPKAPVMDAVLHAARTSKDKHQKAYGQLPVGAMFIVDGRDTPLAKAVPGALPWSWTGYGAPLSFGPQTQVTPLTPEPIMAALHHGYQPLWHPSAGATA